MNRWARSIAVLGMAAVVCACAPSPTVQVTRYGPWADAYRLGNGRVDVVVVPQVGRIMHYGPAGGPNLLWTDAAAAAHPESGWRNWGGDKAWLWPQAEWGTLAGRTWPPPAAFDVGPYRAAVEGTSLRLTSPPVPGYGVRIVRRLELARGSTRLAIDTWLERTPDAAGGGPVATWHVTQVPAPAMVLARASGATPAEKARPMSERAWPGVASLSGRTGGWLVLPRQHVGAKVGLEADVLAAPVGQWLFMQECITARGAGHRPFERAQVYGEPDPVPGRAPGVGGYCEMEFTSPMAPGTAGEPLTVVWSIQRLGDSDLSAGQLIGRIEAGLAQRRPYAARGRR